MARRPPALEPYSRLAAWARRLALFSVVVAALSVAVVRSDLLDFQPALATFGGALAIAGAAVALALLSFIPIWRQGLRGLGRSLFAILVALALLAYPAYLATLAYRLPRLNDITTDPADPPQFEILSRLRANPSLYPGSAAASAQADAYPDVEPYMVETPPLAAYEAALAAIKKRRWLVIDERPPLAGRRDGHIEAVARSAIMGLREDVAVRVRTVPGGARIDLRSASRYGPLDFGSNAARIRQLMEDLEEALSARPRPAPATGSGADTRGQPASR